MFMVCTHMTMLILSMFPVRSRSVLYEGVPGGGWTARAYCGGVEWPQSRNKKLAFFPYSSILRFKARTEGFFILGSQVADRSHF